MMIIHEVGAGRILDGKGFPTPQMLYHRSLDRFPVATTSGERLRPGFLWLVALCQLVFSER